MNACTEFDNQQFDNSSITLDEINRLVRTIDEERSEISRMRTSFQIIQTDLMRLLSERYKS